MTLRQQAELVALETVDRFALRNGFASRDQSAREFRKEKRQLRREVRHAIRTRCHDDTYGFGIEWLLLVALASIISWAIKRWLDRKFPQDDWQ